MWIWLLLLNLFPLGIASLSESADAALPKGGVDQAVSTTITAKKMTVKNQDSQAVFEGAVVLTRGSLVVYSDRMVVMFRPQDPIASDNQKGPEAVKSATPSKGPDAVPAVSNRSTTMMGIRSSLQVTRWPGIREQESAANRSRCFWQRIGVWWKEARM